MLTYLVYAIEVSLRAINSDLVVREINSLTATLAVLGGPPSPKTGVLAISYLGLLKVVMVLAFCVRFSYSTASAF